MAESDNATFGNPIGNYMLSVQSPKNSEQAKRFGKLCADVWLYAQTFDDDEQELLTIEALDRALTTHPIQSD